MGGIFILSLDCEGKWGIADHLEPVHQTTLSDAALRKAYGAIAETLKATEVSATFAFTELLLLSREELRRLPAAEIANKLPYTKAAFHDLEHGSREGWSAPWALDLLDDSHEIASHGVTHTPWGQMSEEEARFELSLVPSSPGRTFIYPRNQISHANVLKEHGFIGYRLAPPTRSRIASLAAEFNLFAAAERNPEAAPLQPIPGGYFVNWLSGPRKLVPPSLTRARARHVLEDAARTGGVAHFWTHPENIASAPATLLNLKAVVEEAARMRDEGRLEILTQADYCRRLASDPGIPVAAQHPHERRHALG